MVIDFIILVVVFLSVFVGHIYLAYFVSFVSFLFVFLYIGLNGRIKWNKTLLFSFLFFSWVVLVNFCFNIYDVSVLGKYSLIFSFVLLASYFRSLFLVDKMQKVMFFASFCAALIVIFNFLTGKMYLGGDRYSIGDYINANYVAYTLVMSIAALYIHRFVFLKKFSKIDLLGIFVIFLGIGLTGSRGAIISFLTISLFYVMKKYFSNIFHGLFVSLGVFVASLLVYLFIPNDILNRLLFRDGSTVDYTSGRSDQWLEALRIISSNPLTGAGADAFTRLNYIYISDENTLQLHNVFLVIIVEFGFIGLVLYLLILISIIKNFFNMGLYKGGFILLIFLGYWLPIALTGIWAYTIPAWVFFSWLIMLGFVYSENENN